MRDFKSRRAEESTDLWPHYRTALDHLNSTGFFERVEQCHRMVNGDQWHGLRSDDDRPAQLNILAPIMKNSTALVGQNNLSVVYGSLNYGDDRPAMLELCRKLNACAERQWELMRFDSLLWNVLQDAYVAGDSFLYFYFDRGRPQAELLDTTEIFLADEQNSSINTQPYILLVQRRYVDDLRREAEEAGLPPEEVALILPDTDETRADLGNTEQSGCRKCTSVMRLRLSGEGLYFAKSTRDVVYRPETLIPGLTRYPIAKYSWKPRKGSARGDGDIWDKIPNQLCINKGYYRFDSAIKANAFPHKVYNALALSEAEVRKLSTPDSSIALRDLNAQGVDKLIAYFQPAQLSPYARDVWSELVALTRELSGAGDNLENVNPENASGRAISAAREAKELNVNMQTAAYRQFIEDIALIWYDMWLCYSPDGLVFPSADGEGLVRISADELRSLDLDVRVDISPRNPYSKLARDSALQELFSSGAITLEELTRSLDPDSVLPKAALEDILRSRRERENDRAAGLITKMSRMLSEKAAESEEGRAAEEKLMELTSALRAREAT